MNHNNNNNSKHYKNIQQTNICYQVGNILFQSAIFIIPEIYFYVNNKFSILIRFSNVFELLNPANVVG